MTHVFNSLGHIRRCELLGQVITLYLTLRGTTKLVATATAPLSIPPAVYEGSSISTSSPTLVIICPYELSHPGGCEVGPHCGFDLHVPCD